MTTEAATEGADAFTAASQAVVEYLNRHTPISDWSVSRIAGGEQVHVHVHGENFLEVGTRVPWDDTFCQQMTRTGHHVVADSADLPEFACLPAAAQVRAYVGFPITDDDGAMFGTLCGVDPRPLNEVGDLDAELVSLLSTLLSSHLASARAADRERRTAQITAALADVDALTGLMNRRGWDSVVDDAQQRIDAFGDLVAVAVVDLDGLKTVNDTEGHAAGDALIRRAAEALAAAETDQDRVARFGGDEFTILTNNVGIADLAAHFDRFEDELAGRGVEASIGHAFTGPGELSVAEAFRRADAAMYQVKRARRAS